jgi:undecaprenyl-diphosphatase
MASQTSTTAGLILVNPGSGPDETTADDLRGDFPGHRVEDCEPDQLTDRVREAMSAGVPFIGVAGGDGTIRAAAEQLAGTDTPLLVVPAGTRNHFAKDLGTGSLEAAAAAATGTLRHVDIGMVNGRGFVNNSSVGIYPKIVVRRELHQRRLSKGIANLVAGWEQLRFGRRITVEVDGTPHRAWLVFVGNGVYGEGLLDLTDRGSLEDGTLDLRVVRADRPLARFRVVAAVVLGRLARSPLVIRKRCRSCTVNLPQATVEVALDGEVETLGTPLRYEVQPRALPVLVPRDADAV